MLRKNRHILFLTVILVITGIRLRAQDPIFSQFYTSPLTINPSLAGNGESDWRLVANRRNQVLVDGGGSLNTTSVSLDGKLFRQKVVSTNYIAGGLQLLQDDGLGGAYKSNSIQAMFASHVSLDEDDRNGLSLGLGASYANTLINYSQLSFGQQLSASGFNRALPTSEPFLNNVQPYYSLAAGVTYTYTTESQSFDIGLASYRFMKTVRTALSDPTQIDPPRMNLHADFQTYLNEQTVFNTNAMVVFENGSNTYMGGVNFGRILDETESEQPPTVLNMGLWYRNNEAVIPYLGMMYKNLQIGLTYDVNVGSANYAVGTLRTFEFSLIIRSPKRREHGIPCPWK